MPCKVGNGEKKVPTNSSEKVKNTRVHTKVLNAAKKVETFTNSITTQCCNGSLSIRT